MGFIEKLEFGALDMTRILASAALLSIALAPAAASAANYAAKPASPVAAAKIIARDVSWACGAAGCRATTDSSRPVVLCQGLAKKAGRIDAFTVNGQALAAAELDKCNAGIKPAAGAALARN